MNKISICENKTLKLQNVITCTLDITSNDTNLFQTEIDKMNIFMQTHGAHQIGPLIQFSNMVLNENNELEINMQFMLQADCYIHNVDAIYKMDTLLRVKNCIYARYMGPDDKIKFAYDKLGVYAFENDIELKGGSYTIYVECNEEEALIVADIFMPIRD